MLQLSALTTFGSARHPSCLLHPTQVCLMLSRCIPLFPFVSHQHLHLRGTLSPYAFQTTRTCCSPQYVNGLRLPLFAFEAIVCTSSACPIILRIICPLHRVLLFVCGCTCYDMPSLTLLLQIDDTNLAEAQLSLASDGFED
jgi:hypothetical protein